MADLVLVLEASAGSGSLALLRGETVVAEAGVPMRGHDGERLMPTLVQLLHDSGAATHDLQRIVCGAGPGGFTSLRIAAAIAKGLAESLGVELWGVS
ncbi:MAG TPA: tRNA (adenosine(37)-N6)-threonylcarbamoyltransferase complex dimerization subunit type 1 TsaB, partial [Gemmatimonadaceae bacterium]|nr:tRNA (adenosine(37)-N6)-threonylcarbamoyltransferase complex dimerization subunit type 1 TsaB [Gemmatimonadaceae bacterium]